MKTIKLLAISLLGSFSLAVQANSELDERVPNGAPQGIIVKVDAQGKREVYALRNNVVVNSDNDASELIDSELNPENRVSVKSGTELDRESSKEAWFWWYNSGYRSNYYYSYHYYGARYYYYPYYNYYRNNCNYYYYRY